jgi:mRNA interferase MazF
VAIDPETQQTYVLVRREVYERLRALLDADTEYATVDTLDRVMAEDDAHDPYLAELQKKYGGRPMTSRANVVIARFPYAGGRGHKVRPAVIVPCDRLNRQIQNTLLAMITGNTRLAGTEPTQFLIDPATPEGASSGQSLPSAVKGKNLATIPQTDIIDTIGHLSDALKQKLNDCLKAALELPSRQGT